MMKLLESVRPLDSRSRQKVQQKIEEWAERSIDLTPRNPLLNSGPRRRRLRVLEPSPEQVWDILFHQEETLILVPEDWTEETPLAEEGQEEQDLNWKEWLAKVLRRPQWSKSPKARISYPAKELFLTLTHLRRRVRSFYDDAGFWTLFLAFGLLRWSPAQRPGERSGPEIWESPLLLLPVNLEQNPEGLFLLSFRQDEEVEFNLALRVYLQNVEKIDLPEIDAENLTETLEKVAHVGEQRGWKVEPICWLNLFSFHKMAIYRDLKDNMDRIIYHPIVQALAGIQIDFVEDIFIDKNSLDEKPSKEIATVLPADSSQLEAVLLARLGKSFWIHGPPGTGKSQTIVNIIADALSQGKSVLFVSEKRAALEVVFRRLREVGLDSFCLDLHDYKTKRGEVARTIANGIEEIGRRNALPPLDTTPAKLDTRRKALADYTRAIHTPRPPLNLTPYQAIGRVSHLPEVHIPGKISLNAKELTQEKLEEIKSLAESLSSLVDIAREGLKFPWTGVRVSTFSERVRTDLLERVGKVEGTLSSLSIALEKICSYLGLRIPSTVEETHEFYNILKEFRDLPPLPPAWTHKRDVSDWFARINEVISALRRFMEVRERLSRFVKTEFLSPDKEAPISVQEVQSIQKAIKVLTSSHTLGKALNQPVTFLLEHLPQLRALIAGIEQALRYADSLRSEFDLVPCRNLRSVRQTVILAKAFKQIEQGLILETEWLRRQTLEADIKRAFLFLDILAQWQDLRKSILQEWREDFLNLNASEALETWERWQRSPFKFLSPSYRRLLHSLKQTFRGKKFSEDMVTQSLRMLKELQRIQTSLEPFLNDPDFTRFLGRYFKGLETIPEQTKEALTLAQNIRNAFPASLPLKVQRLLTGQIEIEERQSGLADALLEIWNDLEYSVHVLGLDEILDSEELIAQILRDLQQSEKALECLDRLWERFSPLLKEQTSMGSLVPLLEDLCLCLEAGDYFREKVKALTGEWGWAPKAILKAWEETLTMLQVWGRLTRWVEGTEGVPASLVRAGQDPKARPSLEHLEETLQEWERNFGALKECFNSPFPLVGGEAPFTTTKFQDLAKHLQQMQERIDDIPRYFDLIRDKKELAKYLSDSAVDAILNNQDLLSTEDIPKVVERLVLAQWLDYIFAQDPILKDFRWERHQQYLKEFRQLDRELGKWTSRRIIYEVTNRGSRIVESRRKERNLILKEARKQRRHLPIRKLIQEAFHTILAVKPCWLMSPLSVSHFLQPDHQFDLVVFDEASQVRPEDAIPAIYRSKQVIICGDPKQLPPTAFFERVLDAIAEEEEVGKDEETPYMPEGQSILEILEGALPSVFLQWHYRSKDERLIAFSNRYIYGDKLITFPTPKAPERDTGIDYIYLRNAVYERSRRRINEAEVQEVCRLVVEHLERWGTERTLGVVTMNEPQMNAILDELERRSRNNPLLKVLWDEARWPNGETFFVKNLEAVQGDERDVIIISTTYGKGPDGRITMQFGPLTQAGGERRLNVLITRAREKVILVTSLQPEEIRPSGISEQAGLRLLKAYLQYARDGIIDKLPSGGEYESEFEASVADFLKSQGYEVIPQYGVGPYRIDLAVRDPSNPDIIRIAVECDGAIYHRLPTVRERDRIRQEWLERQGWKVVRVWSADWWHNRRNAEKRLLKEVEKALEEICNQRMSTKTHFADERTLKAEQAYIGMRVMHRDFGTGTIVEIERNKNLTIATIRFDDSSVGEKRLVLGIAPLEPLL